MRDCERISLKKSLESIREPNYFPFFDLKPESSFLKPSSWKFFNFYYLPWGRIGEPSDLLPGHLNLSISDKDEKILKLMASRREAKIKEDEIASIASKLWEEDKLLERKRWMDKRRIITKNLEKKRTIDNFIHSFRKARKIENLNREIADLERKISKKHEQAKKRQNLLLEKKMINQKKMFDAQAQLQTISKQKKIEFEQIKEDHCLLSFQAKESRSRENLTRLSLEKKMKTAEESRKRELKWLAAQNVREEFHRKLLEKQMLEEKFQKRSDEMRSEKLRKAMEWQKKMAAEKNLAKKLQQEFLMNKLTEEAKHKMEETKRRIEEKDWKIKVFKEKNDLAASKLKIQAKTTAHIRQRIRTAFCVSI